MQTTIMLLFYGFLAGILVMCAGFSTRKRASRRVAETISAAGGTLSACCFFDDFGLRIFVHTAVKSGGQ